jgi:Xaa-Pro aminopeptidase
MPKDRFADRRVRVRRVVRKMGAKAILVTDFTNVSYLTGFQGEDSYLLVHAAGEVLISDGRFVTQLEEECPGLELSVRRTGVPMHEATAEVLRKVGVSHLAIEADSMTVALRERIAEKLPALEMASTSGAVEELRRIKDREEIAAIREAIRQAERAFAVLKATLRPDKTEKQVADELEHEMRRFGARGPSFPSIVAAGPRAALPHARPIEVPVGECDHLLVDWGADAGPYKSDLTRVLITGKISPKLERVYRVVLKAQGEAIAAIRPGAELCEVDRTARRVIEEAGFGRHFGHGLGHGIGMQVHEAPRMAPKASGQLQAGMVITVEPGIYLPGWGGVRIEDDILVTRTGHEVLTSVPKQFAEVVVA